MISKFLLFAFYVSFDPDFGKYFDISWIPDWVYFIFPPIFLLVLIWLYCKNPWK